MSEFLGNKDLQGKKMDEVDSAKAARLAVVIERLGQGVPVEEVRKEFHDIIKGADAAEVAALEQSLINAGTPVEEVMRLCEVHAEVFRSGLEKGERQESMSGHPIHTFQGENREANKRLRGLLFAGMKGIPALEKAVNELRPIIIHYERKENQLFPFLENYGFTGPSKVMWGKHDEIRGIFKAFDRAVADNNVLECRRQAKSLAARMRMMIFMEERILFPNALKRLTPSDWVSVRAGEQAIGYAWVRPGAEWDPILIDKKEGESSATGLYPQFEAALAAKGKTAPADISFGPATEVPLSVGSLPLDWLNRILTSLPVDFSFVDAQDKVRYYSDSPHRVFPRSPAIIGRDVQNCHPPKSVHIVEEILAAFKEGTKDSAEFWIQMGEKFVHISYLAIRDDAGQYLGTLEVSQDATHVRSLSGQRRLPDWK